VLVVTIAVIDGPGEVHVDIGRRWPAWGSSGSPSGFGAQSLVKDYFTAS